MRPPVKTPQQEWFDELPRYVPGGGFVGYCIFTGIANEVRNLVCRITSERKLYVIKGGDGNGHWRFDYFSGLFVVDYSPGTTWGQKIIHASGESLTYVTSENKASIDFEVVTFRLEPAQ